MKNWHNATRERPCPVCHHTDWCTASDDGAVAVCHRVESGRPSKGGGWIHWLGDGSARIDPEVLRRRREEREATRRAECERVAFMEGVKVGVRLILELTEEQAL